MKNLFYQDQEKSLIEHVADVKSVVIFCLLVFGLFAFGSSFFCNEVILYVKNKILDGKNIYYIYPFDAFFLHIKIALFCGIITSFPLLFGRIVLYILPIFKNKKTILLQFFAICVLFEVGIFIAIKFVCPSVVKFVFTSSNIHIQTILSASSIFGVMFLLCFVFAIVMQFPLILIVLVSNNIISIEKLEKYRKFHICGSFILGGILTPPDVVSQIFVALLLIILFEITLFFIKICKNLKQ